RSSFTDKRFFYEQGGAPRGRLLFGAHVVGDVAILCEGIIDAMSWETAGFSALAVGGARLSRDQAEIIKRSRERKIYISGVNDEQGREFSRQATELLQGYVEISEVDYGEYKDANEVLTQEGVETLH